MCTRPCSVKPGVTTALAKNVASARPVGLTRRELPRNASPDVLAAPWLCSAPMDSLERLEASYRDGAALASLVKATSQPAGKGAVSLAISLLERLVVEADSTGEALRLTSAAGDVVAALLAALSSAHTTQRPTVLDALRLLAVGGAPHIELAHPYDDGWARAEVAEGLTFAELRAPLVDALPSLVTLFGDADATVRRELARLCAVMPEARGLTVPALTTAVANERVELTRLAMLFALARLGASPDVPSPSKKDPALSLAVSLIALISGKGDPGEARALLTASTRVGGMGNRVQGFPGSDLVGRAVASSLVAEALRRDDDAMLTSIASGHAAIALLSALWPRADRARAPRTALGRREAELLSRVVVAQGGTPSLPVPVSVAAWHGFAPRQHAARCMGLTRGPSDELVGGVPLWLIARRVCDGHEGPGAWLEALSSHPAEQRLAVLDDLLLVAIDEPWPPVMGPHPTIAQAEAAQRCFSLVRATLSKIEPSLVERLAFEVPAHPLAATALASLVDRGWQLGQRHLDALASALVPYSLAYAEKAWDVEARRSVLVSLSAEQRTAAMAGCAPGLLFDAGERRALLTGLWRFADIVDDAALSRLAEHVASLGALLGKPSGPHEAEMKAAVEGEIARGAWLPGARFADALDALLAKTKTGPGRDALTLARGCLGG